MRKFVAGLVVLVVGLLVGFVPQYAKAHRLQQQADACAANLELAQVRQSAALMYIAATQLNYGNAAGYASQFFDQAQALSSSTSDVALRAALTEVLSARGKITDDLAKGNSAAVGEMQPLVMKIEQGVLQK